MTGRFRSGPPVLVATGSDDIAGTTPLGPEQPFYLGSVSKTYTAALVLRLRDLGLLGLVP